MDYQVIWTEPAIGDLRAITTYIGRNNPAAAQRTADSICERVELLKVVPRMGAPYPRGSQGSVREIVSGKYRIFYQVLEDEKRVEVLTVWHSSRKEPDLPA